MTLPDPLQNELKLLAEALNIKSSEMTVVRMKSGHSERHKELELVQGEWQEEQPWIIIDEEEKVHTLTSAQSLSKIISILTAVQGENFQLKLEKAILERYPIDFHDVWAVAMDRIKKLALTRPKSVVVNLDLDWLMTEIRQEYPNLFYHLDQILASAH